LVINELNVLFCEVLDSAIVASIALQIVDHIRALLLLVESHVPAEAECTHAHGAEDCNDDHNSYKDWRHILHRVVEVVHLHLNLSICSKFQLKGLKDKLVNDGCSS